MSEHRGHASAAHMDHMQTLTDQIENLHITQIVEPHRPVNTKRGRAVERSGSFRSSPIQGRPRRR